MCLLLLRLLVVRLFLLCAPFCVKFIYCTDAKRQPLLVFGIKVFSSSGSTQALDTNKTGADNAIAATEEARPAADDDDDDEDDGREEQDTS